MAPTQRKRSPAFSASSALAAAWIAAPRCAACVYYRCSRRRFPGSRSQRRTLLTSLSAPKVVMSGVGAVRPNRLDGLVSLAEVIPAGSPDVGKRLPDDVVEFRVQAGMKARPKPKEKRRLLGYAFGDSLEIRLRGGAFLQPSVIRGQPGVITKQQVSTENSETIAEQIRMAGSQKGRRPIFPESGLMRGWFESPASGSPSPVSLANGLPHLNPAPERICPAGRRRARLSPAPQR